MQNRTNDSISDETRIEPNEGEVAAKAYDDEVVFMNLTTGVYASIEHCGGLIWEAIRSRHSVREIADLLSQHYDVARQQALDDVRTLTGQLLSEGMVRLSAQSAAISAVDVVALSQTYESPRLVIYRDMEELLALDPPLPQYAEAPWKKS